MRMKYGIELESIVSYGNPMTEMREGYHNNEWYNGLRLEEDGSLRSDEGTGLEIVTEPFAKSHIMQYRDRIIALNNDSEISVNDTCGSHVGFSVDGMNISNIFLWPLLLSLRQGLFDIVRTSITDASLYSESLYRREYNRSYATSMQGYQDYKRGKYYEFNLRERYIEWRGVHVRHLSHLHGDSFIVAYFDFMQQVIGMIDKTVKKYLREGMRDEDSHIYYKEDEIQEREYMPVSYVGRSMRIVNDNSRHTLSDSSRMIRNRTMKGLYNFNNNQYVQDFTSTIR